MRLSGRDELANDPIDDVCRRKEIEQNSGQDVAQKSGLFGSESSNAVKENRHPLHGLHQQLGVGVHRGFSVSVVRVHGVHAGQEKLKSRNDDDRVGLGQ